LADVNAVGHRWSLFSHYHQAVLRFFHAASGASRWVTERCGAARRAAQFGAASSQCSAVHVHCGNATSVKAATRRAVPYGAVPDATELHNSLAIYTSLFYRAMHYSAKRGLAIACRLSVCL